MQPKLTKSAINPTLPFKKVKPQEIHPSLNKGSLGPSTHLEAFTIDPSTNEHGIQLYVLRLNDITEGNTPHKELGIYCMGTSKKEVLHSLKAYNRSSPQAALNPDSKEFSSNLNIAEAECAIAIRDIKELPPHGANYTYPESVLLIPDNFLVKGANHNAYALHRKDKELTLCDPLAAIKELSKSRKTTFPRFRTKRDVVAASTYDFVPLNKLQLQNLVDMDFTFRTSSDWKKLISAERDIPLDIGID